MSRNRLEDILRHLHVRDNLTITAGQEDRLFKLGPMIDLLNFRFKQGYKLWCLACMSGYVYNFEVYQGKFQAIKDDLGFGLGGRVVRQMIECLTKKEHIVIFDNFFSSISLLEKLKEDCIFECCTIHSNRKGLPVFAPDRALNRGSFDQKHCGSIGVYKWKDPKTVLFASNYHGTEVASVKRKN
ncbi:hypothetical protein QYM36_007999 [Artemia franciscana]|uniref:PiggyBac transposable element-derived protein domain-containing protein n=1 Tax=Artemia franciscana TaxID=6661 RepID=A0AA88LM24_ARTSF|nr:hypothetical protein QYM36_007999 [Artemia franciscana]